MTQYRFVRTPTLDVGYLEWNPRGTRTVILVHGWPDGPATWTDVAGALAAQGYRVLAPALRGFAPTAFRDTHTPRSGQLSALGRDLLTFIEVLGIQAPALVGHDWGARAVANACGLRTGVATHLVMMSVGYGTNDPHQSLSLDQTRSYWYHWFMATPRGEHAVRYERHAFTRHMWETWSPPNGRKDAWFESVCDGFDGPDWADVVLHSYRHRWGFVAGDPAYDADELQLNPVPILFVPTLVLHGTEDTCNHPQSSADKERFFSGPYERVLIDGVGHFPQREAPQTVAHRILTFLTRT
ncbi:alpha/beta fold hydrolase [Pandoraea anhela]|uniref:Alpha/beta hydrolase n=1 Tax=Pandoraea anhela TaxID=2508295 RepID=A0A5E4WRP6_9BURK|nr:alpha/beta hydrolase [Pandoraea anhela]VVE26449.1 alpha/beta hydrolase [Pandoraea anhela]